MLSSGAEPKQEGSFSLIEDDIQIHSGISLPMHFPLGDIIFAEVPTEKFCIAASSTFTTKKTSGSTPRLRSSTIAIAMPWAYLPAHTCNPPRCNIIKFFRKCFHTTHFQAYQSHPPLAIICCQYQREAASKLSSIVLDYFVYERTNPVLIHEERSWLRR